MMNTSLPIYKLVIQDGDDSGVVAIALVDEPAIQRTWQMFNSQKHLFKANPDKKIISGFLMVADLPIYRRDEKRGEYYVVFDKPTIEKIVNKFFRNGFTSSVNKMHDKPVEGVYMFESMVIDSQRGIKTPTGYDEAPEGSWFGSFKVDNEQIWNDFIKTGTFKGFSVEGIFDEKYLGEEEEQVIEKVIEAIQG
jgi:hypothetical protein